MKCPKCGSEAIFTVTCEYCGGSGENVEDDVFEYPTCPHCEGSGDEPGKWECGDCGHEWEDEE